MRRISVYPGEVPKRILLTLAVTHQRCLRISVVRHLKMILPRRAHKPQLIRRTSIENQRGERAVSIRLIVQDVRRRRLQAQIGTIAVYAGVIGKTVGVTAEAQLIVGGVIASIASDQLALIVALEA